MSEKTKELTKENIFRVSKSDGKKLKGGTNWAYLFSKEKKEGYRNKK